MRPTDGVACACGAAGRRAEERGVIVGVTGVTGQVWVINRNTGHIFTTSGLN